MKTDISWIPGLPTGRLGVASRPRGGEWLLDEVEAWRTSGVHFVISALTAEEEVELGLSCERADCERNGLRFLSVPIADRGVPSAPAAFGNAVVEAMQSLDAGQTVLVHCRQGIGRASLIAASVLAAAGEDPDAALERIRQARGLPVPDTEEQRNWVRRYAVGVARQTSRRAGTWEANRDGLRLERRAVTDAVSPR
jgi:protein-tyrosine phosphatase